jgi:mono/diheme cytochrome c family protein
MEAAEDIRCCERAGRRLSSAAFSRSLPDSLKQEGRVSAIGSSNLVRIVVLCASLGATAVARAADGDDSIHGWAVSSVSAKDRGVNARFNKVITLSEFAAFALEPGESIDPAVDPAGFYATFTTDLQVARRGKYRFTIIGAGGDGNVSDRDASGTARFSTGFTTNVPGDLSSETKWVALEPGSQRVVVSFQREGDAPARLRLEWEMQGENEAGFAREPIPLSVTTVPKEAREPVERSLANRRGRVLLTELGCVNCHATSGAAAAVLERRPPIALERVAARARGEWLARWIADPQKLNPACGMPGVLSGADAPRDVAALVDLFVGLAASASPPAATPAEPPADPSVNPILVERGRTLYHEVGCVACHAAFDSPQKVFSEPASSSATPTASPAVPFGDLSGKWRVEELAKFLLDPKAVRTHGRMPDFGLKEPEAKAIAHYLATKFTASISTKEGAGAVAADVAPAAVAPERMEAGKKVFNERGCAACHTLGEGMGFQIPEKTKPLAALDGSSGCLAEAGAPSHGSAPRYTFTGSQRDDLRAALSSPSRLVASPAPGEKARLAIEEFRCLRCHEKDEQGGVRAELAPYFRTLTEADLGDEGRLPPRLTGVGGRLRSEWIEEVVANGTRARPYLAARMPKFGADVAKCVANGVAALEGVCRSDSESGRACEPKVDASLAADGRALVGKEGLNCVTCHSFGDRPSAGTPGLDFQAMATRIRADFWRRYALAPLRFKPGTRMPIYFQNGKSEAELLDRDAARQIDAIWAWFEHEKEMPAPDGVPSGNKLVLDVGDRPKVFRTFLERAGTRGIAVGTPQGLHFAFDAEQIRLVEAWSGEFLNVAPVWEGRGGHVAPELGSVVWSAPPGPALLLVPKEALEGDPKQRKAALAAIEWPIDSGRKHGVKFHGYRLASDGLPIFLYELGDGVNVEELDSPVGSDGVRFTREFRVSGLNRNELVMMREPADAAARVVVSQGETMLVDVSSGGDTSKPPPPRILFFRTEGSSGSMTLRYGVRQ